jgi:hypothetical protein
MTADLAMMPAHELVKLYKARKASPVEATKSALARVDAFNPQLNAFQHLDPDSALRQARASEKRWKKGGKRLSDIDGVPITIKDMVLTKGMPTRMGSLATDADGPWTVDAPVAQRLRESRHRPARQDNVTGIWLERRDRFGPLRRHAQSLEDRPHAGWFVGRRHSGRSRRHG